MTHLYDVEFAFNRALDLSSCVNIPLKLFAIYIILTKTPKNLRQDSYFIMDVVMWNFCGNCLIAIGHPYPMFPSRCFRLDGIVGLLVDSEVVSQIGFFSMITCVLHSALGLLFGFFYRYMAFVHPKIAARIKPLWAFCLCLLGHLVTLIVCTSAIFFLTVSYDDYPFKEELPSRQMLFCMFPYGWRKILILLLFVAITIGLTAMVTLASLLFRDIYRKEGIFHPETLRLQRRLLWNLIILTSIVVFSGGIPLGVNILLELFPYIPHANTLCMVSIVVLTNHGMIYAIATLLLFKQYRHAVSKVLRSVVSRFSFKQVVFVKVDSVQGRFSNKD